MKKVLFLLASLLFLVVTIHAQEVKKTPAPTQKSEKQHQMSECCIMKNGKMVHYVKGKEMAISKEMEFHGMKVMPDGSCKMKNGKTVKLKEGECCDSIGAVHKDCQKLLKKS